MTDIARNTAPVAPEAHVLIVDDDSEIRHLVGRFLSNHGYRVTGARNGAEMKLILQEVAIDLIILDIMLPGASGLDLCRELRATRTMPIIMLTARGDDTDRIVGLELGADDYLAKPFNPRELLARIRAVLRRAQSDDPRPSPGSGTHFTFAGWSLDTLRRELLSPSGAIVDLSGGEYELLFAFISHPNRILTREQLLELARARAPVGADRVIDVQLSRLRRKLDIAGGDNRIIKTIRGVGYMFMPKVERR